MMTSKYTRQRDHRRPYRTRSINLSNVASALQSPNSMTLNWNSPEWVTKAVLHLASGDRDTCQYPLARSRVENHRLPANISMVSSIRGRGYASFTVAKFNRRQFTQNRVPPSFLVTNTTGADHGLSLGSICPRDNISSIQLSSCLIFCGDIRLRAHRMGGVSPVSMVCSTASVCPVRAEPGMGKRSTNSIKELASWLFCRSSRSPYVRSNNPRKWSGKAEGSHAGRGP